MLSLKQNQRSIYGHNHNQRSNFMHKSNIGILTKWRTNKLTNKSLKERERERERRRRRRRRRRRGGGGGGRRRRRRMKHWIAKLKSSINCTITNLI